MGGRDALDQRRGGWGQGCIRREEGGVGGRDALDQRRGGLGAGMH